MFAHLVIVGVANLSYAQHFVNTLSIANESCKETKEKH